MVSYTLREKLQIVSQRLRSFCWDFCPFVFHCTPAQHDTAQKPIRPSTHTLIIKWELWYPINRHIQYTLIKNKMKYSSLLGTLINKEIQSGAVAKSYMRKGFYIWGNAKIFPHIWDWGGRYSHIWLCNSFTPNFLIYEENLIFLSVYTYTHTYVCRHNNSTGRQMTNPYVFTLS
jgi:hypothetical protein